jgi:hypothetical protein
MTLDVLISIVATLLGFCGAILFSLGVLRMVPKTIAELSIAYFGYNATQRKSLISQKVDFVCGMWLLALAFISQFAGLILKYNPIVITDYYRGVAVGCLISVIIFLITLLVRIRMISKLEQELNKEIARKNLRDELDFLTSKGKSKPDGIANRIVGYETLEEDAKMTCNFMKKPEESKEEFIRRYAEYLDVDIPENTNLNQLP